MRTSSWWPAARSTFAQSIRPSATVATAAPFTFSTCPPPHIATMVRGLWLQLQQQNNAEAIRVCEGRLTVAAARSALRACAAGRQTFAATPSGCKHNQPVNLKKRETREEPQAKADRLWLTTPSVAVTTAAVCSNETGTLPLPVATVALIHSSDDGCGMNDILDQPGRIGFTPRSSRMMIEFGPEHHGCDHDALDFSPVVQASLQPQAICQHRPNRHKQRQVAYCTYIVAVAPCLIILSQLFVSVDVKISSARSAASVVCAPIR